jgi:hypothetical protein
VILSAGYESLYAFLGNSSMTNDVVALAVRAVRGNSADFFFGFSGFASRHFNKRMRKNFIDRPHRNDLNGFFDVCGNLRQIFFIVLRDERFFDPAA